MCMYMWIDFLLKTFKPFTGKNKLEPIDMLVWSRLTSVD